MFTAQSPKSKAQSPKSLPAASLSFDKRWITGSIIAVGVSVVGWLIFASNRPAFEKYLTTVQFGDGIERIIAEFSIRQAFYFAVRLAIAVVLVTLILQGKFSGSQAKMGGILLGVFLVIDLGWANMPWIVFWDYPDKYATNPVIEFLRSKPYEHRVAALPFRAPPEAPRLEPLYRIEWAQQHFPYYNIQSLDIIQMPRMPEDLKAFESAMFFDGTSNTLHHMTRRWELTNTRYLLGPIGFLGALNQELDPGQRRFRVAMAFDIVPKPGLTEASNLEQLTAVPRPEGPYALFEFTGALPRAKLYSDWQVNTNDQAVLSQLAGAGFDPQKSVLVDGGPVSAPSAASTNQDAGTVDFTSYAPTDVGFSANVHTASVMLLNDKYDGNWHVYVDGKPEAMLRCNYIMRGVYLTPGNHKVEFRYQPPVNAFYISLAGIVVGMALLGVLAFTNGSKREGSGA
jgi:hypothetical protein